MFATLLPGAPATLSLILGCLVLALIFEFSNGFHDAANAVATVIYTHSLSPLAAVIWSGLMNFLGVLLGGIAVAYALVELIPPDVLAPPNGGGAVGRYDCRCLRSDQLARFECHDRGCTGR